MHVCVWYENDHSFEYSAYSHFDDVSKFSLTILII